MIGDQFDRTIPERWPDISPYIPQPTPAAPSPPLDLAKFVAGVTRAEFEALKREVAELKKLLEAAKQFDEATAQPHCEKPEKLRLIFALAKALGVDMSDLGLNESGAAR